VQVSNSSKDAALYLTSLTSDGYRENGNYDRKSALVNSLVEHWKSGTLSYLNFTD
jgi:iron complex outermembrane receptor protein